MCCGVLGLHSTAVLEKTCSERVVKQCFVLTSSVFGSLKNQNDKSTGKAKLISMKRRPLGSLPRCMMGTVLQSLSNREENLTWSVTESILESQCCVIQMSTENSFWLNVLKNLRS